MNDPTDMMQPTKSQPSGAQWGDPSGILSHAPMTTRFAPSPTGLLHLGTVHSALFAWKQARAAGGRFILRIEDIDTGRCLPEYETQILRDLEWLGLDWDGPVLRQSERTEVYSEFLHVLEEGSLIYPCFCTRKEILAEIASAPSAPQGPDGPVYPGTCKHLPWRDAKRRMEEGEPYALRLHMDRAVGMTGPLTFHDQRFGEMAVDGLSCGDIVLCRKETPSSYHLSVTVDDAMQFITHVTRGEDLLNATSIHRILQTLFALPAPQYHHHALLLDEDGNRLSKREKSIAIAALREDGLSPAEIRALAGFPDD
jgi:glutamyl-Q tRNA(Asp) synthetase